MHSLRAFAKRLGVSHTAVEKAVTTGRLAKSVGLDARGRPAIVDLAVARAEWKDNATKSPAQGAVLRSLVEAQRQQALERTRGLKLANDLKAGRSLDATEVEMRWSAVIVGVRTQLLALPTRLKARRPNLTHEDIAAADALIREALEELAGPKSREENHTP